MKYKGDLKKIHKPVSDMSESLSMQHGLSTSKLSSQVRPPQTATLFSPWNCWGRASQRPLVSTKPDWTCNRHLLTHCGNKQHAADYWPPLGLIQLHHLKHPLFSDLIWWWRSFQPLTFWLLTFFMLAPFITLPLPSHFSLFPLVTTNLFLVTT